MMTEAEARALAETELAFWNNGHGHYDSAWVERRAYAMADALRALLVASYQSTGQ
jgi:hypothetical protein